MKSPRQAYVPAVRSYHHGRSTLERIYRRIAASNVVGTLTARVGKRSHASRRSGSQRTGSTKQSSLAAAAALKFDHPQGGVLQKRSHQITQQKLDRAKSRRKARERQLQKVVEDVYMRSISLLYYEAEISARIVSNSF